MGEFPELKLVLDESMSKFCKDAVDHTQATGFSH